jgi:PPM family protein phosphatase
MPVSALVCSHIGQRLRNEDCVRVPVAAGPLSAKGSLFAVADGMGGHSGGGLASRMVCQELEAYCRRLPSEPRSLTPPPLCRVLMEAVFRIDRKIRRQGLRDAGRAEMGTSKPLPLVDTRIDRLQHRDR